MKPGNSVNRRDALVRGATLASGIALANSSLASNLPTRSGKVNVDGLGVYYELYGPALKSGVNPVVLLHGGAMTIETAFPKETIAYFARTRPVIAVEQQGHGHTADRPGLITIDQMVRDTAAVLASLTKERADIIGHSLGGMIGTGLAIRHASQVRSVTTLGAPYQLDGFLPEIVRMQKDPTVEPSAAVIPLLPSEADFESWRKSYRRSAPDPDAYDSTLARLNTMLAQWPGWSDAELQSIRLPFLVVIGDNDFVRVEHAAQMVRLIPGARLAVLPNTNHMGIVKRTTWLPLMQEMIRQPSKTGG